MKAGVESRVNATEPGADDGMAPPAVAAAGVKSERLAEIFKAIGYRANLIEANGIVELQSASQGLSFTVRFGNHTTVDRHYLDYTYYCPLAIQTEFPVSIIDSWNLTRRFAKLTRQGNLLILSMDVLAAGGVPELYLRAQNELWDRVTMDLVLHLRQGGRDVPAAAAQKPAAEARLKH